MLYPRRLKKQQKSAIEAASSTVTLNSQKRDPNNQNCELNNVKTDSALVFHQHYKSLTPGGDAAKENEYLKDENKDMGEERGRTKNK